MSEQQTTHSPPPPDFGEQLFVLATITHVRDYRPTISPSPPTEREKHLRLLNDIALLLVTQGSSDVASVMFEQSSHEIVFYYAKNRATTNKERAYIESLRDIALSLTDINDCTTKLLARVIPVCRAKIISRLKKLIHCLPIPPSVAEEVDDDGFRAHLVMRVPLFLSRRISATDFIRNYFAAVRAVTISRCTDQVLERLIRFASIIGSYKPLKNLLSDDMTIRRLRKLGDYYSSTKRIARTVDSFQRTNPSYLSSLVVVFREVRSPPAPELSPLTNRAGFATDPVRLVLPRKLRCYAQPFRQQLRPRRRQHQRSPQCVPAP